MNADHIWILIAKKLTGEASLMEQSELTRLLADDPAMQERVNVITEFWKHREQPTEEEVSHLFDKLWQKLSHRLTSFP